MLRLYAMLFAGAIVSLSASLAPAAAQSATPSVEGYWQHKNSNRQPEAWFRIQERNGVYEGQIVRMFPKRGEDPTQLRCTKCEGDQRNAPVLGITFIKGMKRDGLKYEDGTILDPRDGSVYSAEMKLSPDGKKLTVCGYLGISLFGQSQVWERLPDTAMDEINKASTNTGSAPRSPGSGAASKSRPAPGAAPRRVT
jgi:uncharacterized protein (DUF2147 family)